MKLPLAIRTTGTTLALLACASMAFAGGSFTIDDGPRPQATSSHHAAPLRATASDEVRAPANLRVAGPAPSSAAPAAPRSPQAPAGDHRPEKREHGRPASATSVHAHRPLTQRSKGSLRNTPATPGMGLLLRMGAGAGRELSLLLDNVTGVPVPRCAGRAPPRAGPSTDPARDPIACAAAPEPPTVTSLPLTADVAKPTRHHPCSPRLTGHACAWPLARVLPRNARVAVASSRFTQERVACSRAPGQKGARA